ncbi:hypothetical protein B0H14DRAFT_3073642 [Mycena olivaceomarginata]|nr:hypothetical protein B0H14DRAFT_3073642 [Mycena olivaceomarginata]
MYLVPRGGTRLRSASRIPRTTPPRRTCAPPPKHSAPWTVDPIRLPPFLRLRPCISARSRRAIGASLAFLAHFPFPVSSQLPFFQSIIRNPIGPGQRQRAQGPLPRPQHAARRLPRAQHAARRPPRRGAIEGSAADAEAGDARAPSSPPPTPAPALAPPHLPTHGLRKASDLLKARDSTGEGRRGVRDLEPLGALKFGRTVRAGVMSSASVYTRDLRGSPKE